MDSKIFTKKNLVHRDFHSGNILKGIEKTSCLITDLGLCKPANEASLEKKVFGVLPYVAPEVLRQQPYTQKSDIYSFGIIAYEMLSGLPPYYDRNHDQFLGVVICNGLRPQFKIKIPQLLEDLIKQCWDNNPGKRPTASELERVLRGWEQGNAEFTKQLQEAEEYNQNLPDNIKFPDYKKKMHTGAVYHSKLLPTKEITKLLSSQSQVFNNSNNSTTITEYSNSLKFDFTKINLEGNKDWTNIDPNFTNELIHSWTVLGFAYSQVRDWINTGLSPHDHSFASWLRDELHLEPLEVLNNLNVENNYQEADLREQFAEYQTHIQQPPK